MKKYITLYLLFHLVSVSAQIQFTRTDFGTPGDKIIYAVDSPTSSGYNFGATGANHTWRFNTKTSYPRRYDSSLFVNTTSYPNDPNLVTNLLQRNIANGDQYLEVTDSFVKTIFDFPQINVSGVKLQTLNFPLAYQSQFVDSTTTVVKGLLSDFNIDPIPPFDSIRINAKVNIFSHCDGWGTVILPDTTSYDAVKVNQFINVEADVYLHSIIGWTYVTHKSQNTGSYSWYAPHSKNYIANVQLDSSGNYTSFTYKIKKSPILKSAGKLLSISPNSVQQGDTIEVIVKGSKTTFTTGEPDIYTYYCDVLHTEVKDDSTLVVTLTCPLSSPVGTNYFRVYTPTDGYLYLNNSFTITASPNAPRLLSMDPPFGAIGQQATVTVKGTNTHFTKGLTVNFVADSQTLGAIYVRSFEVVNDTVFTCAIQVENIGSYMTYSLRTYNMIDGSLALNGAFKIVHTGIQSIHAQPEITVYPNPAKQMLFVRLPENTEALLIQLFDITGKEISRVLSSGTEVQIDMHELTDHFYFCKITGEHIHKTEKIFVEP